MDFLNLSTEPKLTPGASSTHFWHVHWKMWL